MAKASEQPQKINLLAHYERLPTIPTKTITALHKHIGPRWIDLLFHLPSNIIDRRHVTTIAAAPSETNVTLQVRSTKHSKPYNRRQPYKIQAEDDSGSLTLIFFNHGSWIERAFPIGEDVIIHGKLEHTLQGPQIAHPAVWPAKKGMENVAKLWPIYPLSSGLTQNTVTRAVNTALEHLAPLNIPDWLPEAFLKKHSLPNFIQSIQKAHQPIDEKEILSNTSERTRLALDEILANQMALISARAATRSRLGLAQHGKPEVTQKFVNNLPFELTADQQTVSDEILSDMHLPTPMLRLVQGDVGSGKTVVAFMAILNCLTAGNQAALLAPTGILAEQHYKAAQKWLAPLGFRIALLSGKLTAAKKRDLKAQLKLKEIHLVIGTHALVQKDVTIPHLGLIVMDEQHRFGVNQRLTLERPDGKEPDRLLMTATPIPRSLALTFYGDMDVSAIRSKPPGRPPITTIAKPIETLEDITHALKRKLDINEQIYWVCPLVEESESEKMADVTSATERFDYLQKIYKGQVALLHGKIKPEEKDKILADFRDGKFKILVSTTVIEVGIDVPQATTIIIEHAERFGLAQLHQLRGRVGRSADYGASTCILLYTTPLSEYAEERINALRQSEDGFELAEKDLSLRGPGEVLGTKQSGQVTSKLVDYQAHQHLIPLARELAIELMATPNPQTRRSVSFLLALFHHAHYDKILKAG